MVHFTPPAGGTVYGAIQSAINHAILNNDDVRFSVNCIEMVVRPHYNAEQGCLLYNAKMDLLRTK